MSEQQRTIGAVTYREAEEGYFEQRKLRRHAGVWSLWALGVAAVISGDFSGWNLGLDAGGFGGLLVATLIITVMYFGLCYSIAEMSPALPHTGGAYSFSRSAMGPWGGFATGVAETIEYVLTPAVIVTFSGAYLQSIFNSWFDWSPATWVWWLILYILFVGLNVVGVEASFRFTVFICLLALSVLAIFFVASFWEFSWSNLTNIADEDGSGSGWFPLGTVEGVFLALPFAIWFYLAIEELPLAAEESADPKRDIPRGTIYGLITLVVTGFLVLFLNTGVTGAEEIRVSGEPLLDGFRVIFGGSENLSNVLGLAAVAGLIASFHTIIYAYGRNIYSLSRAGYYPHWLSRTHGTRQTPYVALLAGAVVGFGLALLVDQALKNDWLGGNLYAALLSMAVAGAVVSYFLQMTSFILLRRNLPNIDRPYRSPLGIWGAGIGAVIALLSLAACFWRDDYRPGVVGVAIFYLIALAYFGLRGRNQLILSPEEEFALTRGQHGHPETEGYGTTSVADIPRDAGN